MPRKSTPWMMVPALLSLCAGAQAANLLVACHQGVSLSATDVRDVYLGEKQFSKTIKLAPVENAALQPLFLELVLHMDAVRYGSSWVKKSFRDGINPPAPLANDAAVLEFIRHTPGGCGYLGSAPDASVVVIAEF